MTAVALTIVRPNSAWAEGMLSDTANGTPDETYGLE